MNSLRVCILTLASLALCAAPALAAKATKLSDLPGKAYVVRCNPEGTWIAAWTEGGGGKSAYTLYAINAAKGDKREVDSSNDPGGMCWIPNRNMLFYCKGKAVDSQVAGKFTAVTYWTFDTAKGTTKKIPGSDLKDELQTFIIDPVPADDGSKVFHLTITNNLPSFNIYFPASNVMTPMLVKAKIAADYDLSADGQTVYWPMTDNTNGDLVITGWGFKHHNYNALYEIAKDPATGRGGFKVDSTNKVAVTMATSKSDPALKAVVYSFKDPKNPVAIPVHLDPSENIKMVDWKGRTGLLYMVVGHETGKGTLYSIIEVNPTSGTRTVVLPDSTDEIQFADYAPRSSTYFYTAVDPRGKGTRVVKLQ